MTIVQSVSLKSSILPEKRMLNVGSPQVQGIRTHRDVQCVAFWYDTAQDQELNYTKTNMMLEDGKTCNSELHYS
jgi:hypothetical protein